MRLVENGLLYEVNEDESIKQLIGSTVNHPEINETITEKVVPKKSLVKRMMGIFKREG